MAKWEHVSQCATPPHLPPVEVCVALVEDSRGTVRPIEKFATPIDHNGIPNPHESLRLLASLIDSTYQLPGATNVHHQVHYRTEYSDPIERSYRESPSLMMNMPVQLHNLDHAILLRAPKPPERVMEQYVHEQKTISTLFRLGSAALRNARLAETLRKTESVVGVSDRRELLDLLASATRRARSKRKLYEKTLTRSMPGSLGLMPDPDVLDAMGMADATTYLGKIGGNEFLDFRRASQVFIQKYGIQQSQAIDKATLSEEPDIAA